MQVAIHVNANSNTIIIKVNATSLTLSTLCT